MDDGLRSPVIDTSIAAAIGHGVGDNLPDLFLAPAVLRGWPLAEATRTSVVRWFFISTPGKRWFADSGKLGSGA
jgi:hypothetical protein